MSLVRGPVAFESRANRWRNPSLKTDGDTLDGQKPLIALDAVITVRVAAIRSVLGPDSTRTGRTGRPRLADKRIVEAIFAHRGRLEPVCEAVPTLDAGQIEDGLYIGPNQENLMHQSRDSGPGRLWYAFGRNIADGFCAGIEG